MKNNPLKKLESLGQAIWLDYIRRDLVIGGDLEQMISQDGLRGMTSNPAIFEKAIAESNLYDTNIQEMSLEGKDAQAIYEALSQKDVQDAADVFRSVFDQTNGLDGYVSLEVNPHLAHDSQGTVMEGRRLWEALNRPNVFIKVPATIEGLPAIRQLISEGININVTLLFGLSRYRAVAEAYVQGLEDRLSQGKPISEVTSVASFFLSRIDTLVDPLLEEIMKTDDQKKEMALHTVGKTAIACAKAAFGIYREIYGSDRFRKLEAKEARVQRLLWASTSSKNPAYSDVMYVESLIGKNTVNTIPPQTLDAYRDHGQPELTLETEPEGAHKVLSNLAELGIDLEHFAQQLEDEGVSKFKEPFDKLMESLALKSFRKKMFK
jgi:transaldolase